MKRIRIFSKEWWNKFSASEMHTILVILLSVVSVRVPVFIHHVRNCFFLKGWLLLIIRNL